MNDINYKIIPCDAFIVKNKYITQYIPEIELKLETFNNDIWKSKFPYYSGVDCKKLQLTNIGIYSIVSPENSKNLISVLKNLNILYKFVNNFENLVITDATGGVGGFSIRLCKEIKKINIVEISKVHTDIIKHNLTAYGADFTHIKIYNDNYLDIMHNITQDVILFDLPWNGPKYKLEKNISLGLNNINIWYIINDLYINNRFKICIIIVPKNFNFQEFIIHITPNILINKTNKHFYIIVINV